ncbi:sulfite exporter TauE/SafE family protein [Psychrobacillus psychrodurans]|jgi:uncharacterized membrane protein YfcA|uniref:sulfite exporter TauE/SafE family protein n=1 Tax=Psychrobacillus TaxID=1221880 RepID=UPI0008E65268|nr:sulfite exporter TauE/SafE family protein [Psychrobacillus psychrodurans]MCK1999139.1 sulfite exporter TauE/SafE family protein [Psychrobacillus psychrodurans]MCZ8541312.1 sulfite exporter TauE/SafE family protein [Psychrobacillus psychrodurans]SFM96030.1 hypothetical protein SAMN05421832_1105 [Psychrobacillus psychrodurans]
MEFLIFFIIGIVGNVVGTLVGGGGLISLPMMLLMGLPVHSAIGANKVSNTVSSLSSFLVIFTKKEVTGKEALSVLVFCLGGGIIGGLIASFLSGEVLTIIAIILLSFAFVTSFMGKGNFGGKETFQLNKKTVPALLGIGMYDGMFGPGSSTLALYLYASEKIAYIRAVGLARIGVFSSCFGASITYISTGKIIWPVTLALMLGAIIGAQLGLRLARKLKAEHVKPLLRVVTILLLVQIVVDYLK